MKQKKISYLINFESEKQREEFKSLLGVVRYKSILEVTEAIIEALRRFEKGLKQMREKLMEVEYLLGEFPNSKELSKMRRKLIKKLYKRGEL